MWLYDVIIFIYLIFNLISYCKNGRNSSLRRKVCYMIAILLKVVAQLLICGKLEFISFNFAAKIFLAPVWLLLPILAVDVFIHLIKHCRY